MFLLWEWGGLSSGSTAHVSSKWPTFFPCMCSTVSKSVNLRRQQRFRLFFYRVNFQCYGWMVQKFKNASVPEAWNSASGLFQSPLSHKGMIHRYIWSFNTRKGLNYWTEFATTVLYVLRQVCMQCPVYVFSTHPRWNWTWWLHSLCQGRGQYPVSTVSGSISVSHFPSFFNVCMGVCGEEFEGSFLVACKGLPYSTLFWLFPGLCLQIQLSPLENPVWGPITESRQDSFQSD